MAYLKLKREKAAFLNALLHVYETRRLKVATGGNPQKETGGGSPQCLTVPHRKIMFATATVNTMKGHTMSPGDPDSGPEFCQNLLGL